MGLRQNLSINIYVTLTVIFAACAMIIASLSSGINLDLERLSLFTGFALAVLLVQLLPVPFPHGTQLELVRLEEAVIIPLALLTDPLTGLLAVGVGISLGHAFSKAAPIKSIFNTAQLIICTGVVFWVVRLLTGQFTPGFSASSVGAVAIGLSAMFVVNQLLVSGILRIVSDRSLREILITDFWLKVAMWVANAAVGTLLILPAVHAPWLLLVALVPLVMLHGAWRIHSDRARDEQKLRDLGNVVSELAAQGSLQQVAQRLAEAAREIVSAAGAEVKLFELNHAWWSHLNEGELVVGERSLKDGDQGEVRSRFGREAYSITLSNPANGVVGEMSVWVTTPRGKPEIFSRRDRALLEMLAFQAATSLDNALLKSRTNAQQQTISQVFNHSREGMLVLDAHGRIRGWNPAMKTMSGFDLATVNASPISLISPQLSIIPDEIKAGTVTALISTADGEQRHIRASYAPIEGDEFLSNEITDTSAAGFERRKEEDPAWVVVVQDLTAQREAERLKDDFVATVSHELRTPLTAIKGFLDTMQRDDIELGAGQVRMFLSIMSEQAERLERLIGDLLDMSAIESGRQLKVDLAPVDLDTTVRKTVTAFMAGQPEINVLCNDLEDGVIVEADASRLEQVIANLLDNARKHGGEKSTITVNTTKNSQSAFIRVTDEGPGISALDQRRIFERFFVTSGSVTRNGGGAGLGLYICQRLIAAMNGRIDVESQPGAGATFVVELPLRNPRLALSDATVETEISS